MKPLPLPTENVHRAALGPMLGFTLALGLPVCACTILIVEGRNVCWLALAVGLAGGAVPALMMTVLLVRLFPYCVSTEGLVGYSAWGVRRFIRWQDIAEVRPFRLFNLRYLRLCPRNGPPTWVAMSLARRGEFVEDVRRFATEDCPILQHIGSR